jgi:phosphoglucosamine mutase
MKKFVVQYGADIGIALDGDADRVIMVDENANDIDGDQIMALCALNLIRDKKLKDNILVVTDYSNLGLDKAIKNANGKVIRVMNGDRYVVEEMRKHNYNLGGEQSGHIVFLDYTTTGDGTISALQVLRIMKKTGKKLSELIRCITKFPQLIVNVKVRKKIDFEKMSKVMEKINKAKEKLKNNGRVIVRYSGTQNLARIMVEGINEKEIRKYAKEIADEIKKQTG